jgi:hypothetical protein
MVLPTTRGNAMKYEVSKAVAESALAQDHMTLEDYDPTILGMISDGVEWQVLEDSLLDEDEALEWADRAASYGEIVGLYRWEG